MNTPIASLALLACAASALAAPSPGKVITLKAKKMSCEAVNRAVKRLPAAGGTINLPEGDFPCKAPILLDRDHVALIGAGSQKTHFHAASGNPLPLVIIGSIKNTRLAGPYHLPYPDHQTRDVRLEGLDLDGGFRPPHKLNDRECWNPRTRRSQACGSDAGAMIRNNGLTLRGAEDIRVKDVNSHNNYSGGIVTEKTCQNLSFDQVDLHHNFYDGFAGYETTASVIRNFKVHDNGFAGISLDASFNHNLFVSGRIFANHDVGVFSADVDHDQYDRLVIEDNWSYGMFIENFRTADGKGTVGSCDGTEITNSDFRNNGNGDPSLAGKPKEIRSAIRFAFSCQEVRIDGVHAETEAGGDCLTSTYGVGAEVTNSTCKVGGKEIPWNGHLEGHYQPPKI